MSEKTQSTEVLTARKKHTLKEPIVQSGKLREAGEQVFLSTTQAERLKESKHI